MTDRATILIVDDDAYVREGLQNVLHYRRRTWRVLDADGVNAAEAALESAAVDAVITDITMPVRDGLELLKSIRTTPATNDLPVVVLTGLLTRDIKRHCLELGATDFLNKPADPDELVARMENMLRLKFQQDTIKAHNSDLERRVEERTAQLHEANLELIWRLARAAETRDTETGSHILRVGLYSRVVGEALGLETSELDRLQRAALLHDVGKIGIPDRILNKPGKFDLEERRIMEEHCHLGYAILITDNPMRAAVGDAHAASTTNPLLSMAADIALAHHEKWDGSGYPQGFSGEAIPLAARIVAVVDVFDALTSDRVYRAARDVDEVLAYLEGCRGTHFDPAVLDAFQSRREAVLAIHARYAEQAVPA